MKKGTRNNRKLQKAFAKYRDSLPEDPPALARSFQTQGYGVKVVGVGSVGNLLRNYAADGQRTRSTLPPVQARAPFGTGTVCRQEPSRNHGQRVVHGCRMMQSASDMFLGWTEGDAGRHFYIRQLKDMKIKPMVEVFTPASCWNMPICVVGRSLTHTRARANRSRSAAILAKATSSTKRSRFCRRLRRSNRTRPRNTDQSCEGRQDRSLRGRGRITAALNPNESSTTPHPPG